MNATAERYAQELRLHVAGRRYGAGERETRPVHDPATGDEIARLPMATRGDLEAVLASTARGFARWRNVPAYDRAIVLRDAARLIRERKDAIAATLTLEQGKPLGEARLEVEAAADVIEWSGEEGRRAYGRVIPARARGIRHTVLKEPVGPVAAFTPWNFPAITPARKLAGALGAGCSLVLKPAEETPGTALALVDALVDAGLPEDVVDVVFGVPAEISETLLASPVIRKISFTGSTVVGKHLAGLAARTMKRATLELGGHAPVIVSDKADLGKAIALCVANKFRNAGQVCVSPTRFLVQRTVYADFVDGFAAKASGLVVGHGLDPATKMGTLANARRRESIAALVEDARARGGEVRTGGTPVGDAGFFYAPTVMIDVPAGARATTEEPFGPIALISAYDTLDEAIAQANALPYGLAAYAFTQDVGETIRLGDEVEAGMLGINGFAISLAELPFGGVKDSGYGSEGGVEGVDGYLVTKSVTFA